MPLSEHVYRGAIAFKITEPVEQWICFTFCIELEHSSTENIWMIQKAAAKGNWWLAASSRQSAFSCIMSHAEFFGKTSNHPADSAPIQLRFGALQILAFPKTKITFEREESSDCWRFRKIRQGSWWPVFRSQGVYFEGDWGIICPMYNVSSILYLLQ